MKQMWIIAAAFASLVPAAALAQQGATQGSQSTHQGQQSQGQQNANQGQQNANQGQQNQGQQNANQGQQNANQARLKLPPGATQVATAEVDNVRAFPEQQSSKDKGPTETLVDVKAVDRVYQTDRAYSDVVKFFDQQAKESGNKQRARDTNQTSTAWTIALPQGRVVNVIARNTQPTTIEIISASDVIAEIQTGTPAGH
jgi:hypothetical protein